MADEVNVCCPYLRTIRCADTKEHHHLICRRRRDLPSNDDVLYHCISDGKYLLCAFYEQIEEVNYESN